MQFILKMLLGQILGSEETKKAVMTALRAEAAKTDTQVDDEAVSIFGTVWDIVVPILVGQVK